MRVPAMPECALEGRKALKSFHVTEHSDAVFSHSLCPDCARLLYPEVYDRVEKKLEGNK